MIRSTQRHLAAVSDSSRRCHLPVDRAPDSWRNSVLLYLTTCLCIFLSPNKKKEDDIDRGISFAKNDIDRDISLAINNIDRDISIAKNYIDRDISLAKNDIDREGVLQRAERGFVIRRDT